MTERRPGKSADGRPAVPAADIAAPTRDSKDVGREKRLSATNGSAAAGPVERRAENGIEDAATQAVDTAAPLVGFVVDATRPRRFRSPADLPTIVWETTGTTQEDGRRANHVPVRDPGNAQGAREGGGRQGRRRPGPRGRAAARRRARARATSCSKALPGSAKTLLGRATALRARRGLPPHPVHAGHDADRDRRRDDHPRRRDEASSRGRSSRTSLLADEINRTPPRTQSALLEAMAERSVTVEGRVHRLPDPFLVIATQNPFEQEGVFPLPESHLDRFLFKIDLDYCDLEHEVDMLRLPHTGVDAGHARRDHAAARDRRPRQGPDRARRDDRAGGGRALRRRRRAEDARARRRHARGQLPRRDPPDERDEGERAARGRDTRHDRGRPHDGAVRAAATASSATDDGRVLAGRTRRSSRRRRRRSSVSAARPVERPVGRRARPTGRPSTAPSACSSARRVITCARCARYSDEPAWSHGGSAPSATSAAASAGDAPARERILRGLRAERRAAHVHERRSRRRRPSRCRGARAPRRRPSPSPARARFALR